MVPQLRCGEALDSLRVRVTLGPHRVRRKREGGRHRRPGERIILLTGRPPPRDRLPAWHQPQASLPWFCCAVEGRFGARDHAWTQAVFPVQGAAQFKLAPLAGERRQRAPPVPQAGTSAQGARVSSWLHQLRSFINQNPFRRAAVSLGGTAATSGSVGRRAAASAAAADKLAATWGASAAVNSMQWRLSSLAILLPQLAQTPRWANWISGRLFLATQLPVWKQAAIRQRRRRRRYRMWLAPAACPACPAASSGVLQSACIPKSAAPEP